MTNQYMTKLYHDLLSNSPQTVTIDIPADMGTGQISQVVTKQGAVVSDWKMNYFSDMNVQGVSCEDYIQLLFCFNDGVSWNIADARQSVSIQKGESCIYRGHGKMEYLCYSGKKDFLFKNIKIPMPYFHKILNDYFEDSEINAYEKKLLTGISKVSVTPYMEHIFAEVKDFTQYRGGLGYRERHPASLSGGQKQRVTIGAAIVKGSPVIYFDEPTSGLDYDSMVRVSKLIEQLSSSGVIVFVVSHDFEFIVRTCTEVVQLDDDGAIQNQRLSPEILKTLSEKYFN